MGSQSLATGWVPDGLGLSPFTNLNSIDDSYPTPRSVSRGVRGAQYIGLGRIQRNLPCAVFCFGSIILEASSRICWFVPPKPPRQARPAPYKAVSLRHLAKPLDLDIRPKPIALISQPQRLAFPRLSKVGPHFRSFGAPDYRNYLIVVYRAWFNVLPNTVRENAHGETDPR